MPVDKLLHMTDFHFWSLIYNPLHLLGKRFLGNVHVLLRRRYEFHSHRAEEFADEAMRTGVTHVLCSGDFSSTATELELRAGAKFVENLENRGLTPFAIPGNHDVYTFESLRTRRFERHFERWVPEEGFPARRRLPGGTPIIFAPTVVPNLLSSKGKISSIEIAATVELLQSVPEPVLVTGHYPMLHETYAYRTNPDRRLRNAEAFRRALGESGKRILYVAGHVHRFSFVQDADYENLFHLTTGAFFRDAEESQSQGEFSEIHVEPHAFHVTRHILRTEWHRTVEEPRVMQRV